MRARNLVKTHVLFVVAWPVASNRGNIYDLVEKGYFQLTRCLSTLRLPNVVKPSGAPATLSCKRGGAARRRPLHVPFQAPLVAARGAREGLWLE